MAKRNGNETLGCIGAVFVVEDGSTVELSYGDSLEQLSDEQVASLYEQGAVAGQDDDQGDSAPPDGTLESELGLAVDAPDPDKSDTATLGEYIETGGKDGKHLTIPETVALARQDPDRAQAVIDAEILSTGNDPRDGVIKQLVKLRDSE